MDIRLEVAFQEAMDEINDLNRRLILERSIRKQLEEELEMLRNRNKEMEEINDLNKRLVLERSMKRQMEEELKRIIDENKGLKEEIEKLKKEK